MSFFSIQSWDPHPHWNDNRMIQKKIVIASMVLFVLAIFGFYEYAGAANQASSSMARIKITGQITDSETGDALHYANVFLSRTTFGCASFSDGSYAIANVPLGTYELVVSMIGYETEKYKVRFSRPIDINIDFKMKQVPIEAPEIQITAPYPHEWKKNLKKFEDMFLGDSEFASECKILNPFILDFVYDSKTDLFRATSREPLKIENRALGYHIIFYLKDFTATKDIVRYLGESKFEPLKADNEEEQRKWKENRLKAYQGSMRHFFASLGAGKFSEDEFLVYRVDRLPVKGKQDFPERIDPSYLLSSGEAAFERRMHFEGYLKVISAGMERLNPDVDREVDYSLLVDDANFDTHAGRRRERSYEDFPLSWLKLNTDNVTITKLGYIDDPYAFTIYGQWATERFAQELPWDYIPEKIN